jgi:Ran GTPase-activating protein (RanGAP) involved in mRNA processing and transport
MTCGTFLRSARALFARGPLEQVTLRGCRGRLAEVLAEPRLARLSVLGVTGVLLPEDFVALAAGPHLTRLRQLALPHTCPDRDALASVAGSPALARLTHLNLVSNLLDHDKLGALAASPHLAGLRSLELSGNARLGVGASLLAGPQFAGLTQLSLRRCQIDPAALRALTAAHALPNLRRLDLSANPLTAEGVALLARSALLPRLHALSLATCRAESGVAALAAADVGALRRLDLAGNGLGGEATAALAGGAFRSLVELNLTNNRLLGAEGAAALGRSAGLARLRSLNLLNCSLRPEGAEALTASATLGSLTHLILDSNNIGTPGVRRLAGWAGLAGVRVLSLGANQIDDDGVRALAASPHLGGLRRLHLDHNPLSNEAARALAASPNLRSLRELSVWGNRHMNEDGARALAASPHLPHLLALRVGTLLDAALRAMLREHGKGVA